MSMKAKNHLILLGFLSLVTFVLLMLSSTVKAYGFFIDEVYFMACANRPAWGYIDQPPLSIALLSLMQYLFGNSIYVVRILPALSVAATVFVAGLITKRIGGGIYAILISGLATMVLPVLLVFGSFYSMNAYEPLIWALISLFAVKMIQENNSKYWLHIGIFMGIGLEMKHTIVMYGLAMVMGLFISYNRKLLFNRWVIWGGIACFILVLPNLIWQIANNFPSLELYSNSFSTKNIEKPYLEVIIDQVVFSNPFLFPLCIAGLVYLLIPLGKPYRFMAFAYFILLFILVSGRSSRPDRIAASYIFLFASGAVAFERLFKFSVQKYVLPAIALFILAGGIVLAPIFLPILPPENLKKYISTLGLSFDIEENKQGEPIPQWLADRIGWQEMAMVVAEVYHALPEDEQKNTVIVTTNYGEAGALEYYGPELGLPPVYATHNSYSSWGPPSDSIKTYIGVYLEADDVRDKFDSIELVRNIRCAYCTRPQQNIPVFILRGPKFSIEEAWDSFRHYN